MKLRIRYENTYQNIELSPADTQDLWVCLSLEGDDLSEKEREARIQEAWEIRFNRPDYAMPQHSPKKQARAYRFALLNRIKEKHFCKHT